MMGVVRVKFAARLQVSSSYGTGFLLYGTVMAGNARSPSSVQVNAFFENMFLGIDN
jgi:hypothetical protein